MQTFLFSSEPTVEIILRLSLSYYFSLSLVLSQISQPSNRNKKYINYPEITDNFVSNIVSEALM